MDPTSFYSRRPFWVRAMLLPIMVPIWFLSAFVLTAGMFGFMLLLILLIPVGLIGNLRYRRSLRARGQIVGWNEAFAQVSRGSATLIVEVGTKGEGRRWLIDATRDQIDPDHIVPSWPQYMEGGFCIFLDTVEAADAHDRWSIDHLLPYKATSRLVWPNPSESQWKNLPTDILQNSVLAVFDVATGSLSS